MSQFLKSTRIKTKEQKKAHKTFRTIRKTKNSIWTNKEK